MSKKGMPLPGPTGPCTLLNPLLCNLSATAVGLHKQANITALLLQPGKEPAALTWLCQPVDIDCYGVEGAQGMSAHRRHLAPAAALGPPPCSCSAIGRRRGAGAKARLAAPPLTSANILCPAQLPKGRWGTEGEVCWRLSAAGGAPEHLHA